MATYNLCKTFQDMCIQAETNYIPGHRGCIILQQLVGLLPPADTIYICGYKHRDNCDFARSRLLCMTAEDDSASKLVANIGMALAEAYNFLNNPHTPIVQPSREKEPQAASTT